MKILLINVTYGIGSTGKIVESLHKKYLEEGHDSFVVVGRKTTLIDKRVTKLTCELESKIWHLFSKITGNLYCVCPFSTSRIKRYIKKIKPDVVHLHCLNGFFVNIPNILCFLEKNKINTVLTNHADFMFTGNCGYAIDCNKWINDECKNCENIKRFNGELSLNFTNHYYKKMYEAISSFSNLKVTSVSDWLSNRVSSSKMFSKIKTNCSTILNPVSIIDDNKKYTFSKTGRNVLYITADFNNPEKGGAFIFKLAKECAKDNINFYVKSGKKYSNHSVLDNVFFIDDKDVDIYSMYRAADCCLLLSIRETFSMVVAESLMCGTPVVGFESGGPESIGIVNYSKFVKFGDVVKLREELLAMLNMQYDRDSIKKAASIKYSIDVVAADYISLYEK